MAGQMSCKKSTTCRRKQRLPCCLFGQNPNASNRAERVRQRTQCWKFSDPEHRNHAHLLFRWFLASDRPCVSLRTLRYGASCLFGTLSRQSSADPFPRRCSAETCSLSATNWRCGSFLFTKLVSAAFRHADLHESTRVALSCLVEDLSDQGHWLKNRQRCQKTHVFTDGSL